MQRAIISWATVQKRVAQVTSLGLIALLLVGAAFAALPVVEVQAAALCTNVASMAALNWGDAATWDCGHVPTSADDVSIVDAEVDLSVIASVHNLTIGDFGLLTFLRPVFLDISGDLTVTAQGLLDPGDGLLGTGGTIRFVAAGMQTITTNDGLVSFWNLKKVATGAGQGLSFNTGALGQVLVQNNLTLRGTATNNLLLRSTAPATQWNIESDGPRDLNWLDVQDSNNVSDDVISVVNHVNAGNNTGWATDADTFSSVAVATPANPANPGVEVLLTFRVYPNTATGQVAFKDGGVNITDCESIPLTGSEASCSAYFTSGNHSITVEFRSGDSNFTNATSIEFLQVVNSKYFMPVIHR